eukprot:CAMPEP_0170350502 /NCGR_PEP_ID=MMETSP0116_2-20130129/76548_1 /TAXON_ID=400756 /ORGANISM="Durinskia baltica, Strain CSIRO CS-38" /LENGTH=45 /DNA_ID= /DNA_START= /DNA_END= /DNA_ORIENTATION=
MYVASGRDASSTGPGGCACGAADAGEAEALAVDFVYCPAGELGGA